MKLSKSFSKILENKYVLYIVFFLAVTNLFSYMVANNNTAVAFFIVTAVLIYYFNKNMILVLGVPLILTSIFAVGKYKHTCRKHRQKLEGMKSMGKEGNKNMKNNGDVDENPETETETGTEPEPETEEPEQDPEKEVPEPEPEKFSGINNKKNNRIDYAATVEDAYSDLSKVLGGDGIKNLTSDTQKLMKQQLQLAEAMQSMTPLLEQAKSLIGGFDMKNFDGIASLAKNLNMPVPGQ
uniref:Uncharacterized protein n=1 Tax=viral metagenome TaxID=1070528 RepID=A0A6C0D9E4_9ZZZZ